MSLFSLMLLMITAGSSSTSTSSSSSFCFISSSRPLSSSARWPSSTMKSTSRADLQTEESEEERLRLDAEARDRMAEHVKRVQEAESKGAVDRGSWKWKIRQSIWDLMENNNIVEDPRPVHHRIPNFKGASDAAQRLAELPEFQQAQCLKCNPDTPQRQVRFLTLEAGKRLLVPQPRLRTGFFSALRPAVIPKEDYFAATSSAGVKKYGEPLAVDGEGMPKVDVIIVGSVAVDPKTGARLGKGEGFAELEYGILRMLGAIDKTTPIITSIRDEQLVNGLPDDKLLKHDVPVDIIVTPTQVIRTITQIPKPTGIYWDLLSPEKLASIRVLQILKKKIEDETGRASPSEVLPPVAGRGAATAATPSSRRTSPSASSSSNGRWKAPNTVWHLVLRNLPFSATEEDLIAFVQQSLGLEVDQVLLLKHQDGRPNGMAFLLFSGNGKTLPEKAMEPIIKALDKTSLGGRTIKVSRWIDMRKK